jgi:hypothetical protein
MKKRNNHYQLTASSKASTNKGNRTPTSVSGQNPKPGRPNRKRRGKDIILVLFIMLMLINLIAGTEDESIAAGDKENIANENLGEKTNGDGMDKWMHLVSKVGLTKIR